MSKLYLILDDKNNVMTIEGVNIFGRRVSIPAVFTDEADALEILFAVEEANPGLAPQHIDVIEGSITGTLSTR